MSRVTGNGAAAQWCDKSLEVLSTVMAEESEPERVNSGNGSGSEETGGEWRLRRRKRSPSIVHESDRNFSRERIRRRKRKWNPLALVRFERGVFCFGVKRAPDGVAFTRVNAFVRVPRHREIISWARYFWRIFRWRKSGECAHLVARVTHAQFPRIHHMARFCLSGPFARLELLDP